MKKTFLLSLLLLLGTALRAVPAYNDWIDFLQPHSKQTIRILLLGDERVHWAESEEGYSLLYGEGGDLYYAQPDGQGGMEPSPYMATPKELRVPEVDRFLSTLTPHLRFSQKQVDQLLSLWKQVESHASKSKAMADVLGEKKFLVILFAFSDQSFTHTKQEFQHLFNQVGYHANSAVGSVHDYYYQVSHGQFSLSVDVVGPYTGVHETAHYGNSDGGYQDFATEAVQYASADVDFSDYDNDHDGYIDGLHIIFAGVGEEAGGGADKIWSHKWNIFSEPVYNRTIVNVYSCSPEISGNLASTGSLTAIGVICHELGHVFGSPDYYDTDYSGSGGEYPGLGKWDIMSSGSWNDNGRCPAHHNPYTKMYIYHWATCDTLSAQQLVTMRDVTESNTDFHRINTSTEGDFFLLENRQQRGWDTHIPGHGLLIYHVHPTASGASVSNYCHPQQIYILAYSNDTLPTSLVSSYGSLNSSGASYPGTSNRTEASDRTTPSLRPWSGQYNHTPLTYISENQHDSNIVFCFMGGEPFSSDLSAWGVSNTTMRLSWKNWGTLKSVILLSEEDHFGTPQGRVRVGDTIEGGGTVCAIGQGSNVYVDGLDPNTTYHFRVYNLLTDSTYASTVLSASGSTLGCDAWEWNEESFDSCGTHLPDCWSGDWTVDHGILTATGADRTVTSAPMSIPGLNNVVRTIAFEARFHDCGPEASLTVRYRAATNSEWVDLITLHPGDAPDWTNFCAPITAKSDYALFQFHFQGGSDQARVQMDNFQLFRGCCVHAYTSDGGTITNEGYHVMAKNDTISFALHSTPGWQFTYLYVDNTNLTGSVHDDVYTHKVTKHNNIYFLFTRNYGIDAQPDAQPLRLYPNPTTGLLHIEGADLPVQLLDLYGRRLMEGTTTLDLSPLPRGMYLLRCGTQTQKIIKQ